MKQKVWLDISTVLLSIAAQGASAGTTSTLVHNFNKIDLNQKPTFAQGQSPCAASSKGKDKSKAAKQVNIKS